MKWFIEYENDTGAEDDTRLDWLEGLLRNMNPVAGGSWLRLGDNGRLQIHRIPQPFHPTFTVWYDELCVLDSIPSNSCNVRETIDIAQMEFYER